MIGYHYSPQINGQSIRKHGLLVPLKHPRLTKPVTCSEGHRNPHISLTRTPAMAWELSGGFLLGQMCSGNRQLDFDLSENWDLYQVYLPRGSYRAFGYELQSTRDIPKRRVQWVGRRSLASHD